MVQLKVRRADCVQNSISLHSPCHSIPLLFRRRSETRWLDVGHGGLLLSMLMICVDIYVEWLGGLAG